MKITIEWKHYAKKGETCTRCNNTGDNIKIAIKELTKRHKNTKFNYIETELDAKNMPESNSILINNILIEDVLGLKASENHCHSCTCLEGSDTNCRTIVSGTQTYEEVPKEFILLAVERVLSPTPDK